jgi:hypothetical protein
MTFKLLGIRGHSFICIRKAHVLDIYMSFALKTQLSLVLSGVSYIRGAIARS